MQRAFMPCKRLSWSRHLARAFLRMHACPPFFLLPSCCACPCAHAHHRGLAASRCVTTTCCDVPHGNPLTCHTDPPHRPSTAPSWPRYHAQILDSNTRAISKAMELSDDPDQPGIFGMTRRTREVVIVAAIVSRAEKQNTCRQQALHTRACLLAHVRVCAHACICARLHVCTCACTCASKHARLRMHGRACLLAHA
eukprot:355136-Chlamydomonas_euryale.AAC.1